ncbi:MAG: PH domain-containing protein [Saprospiraceae bacterium]|nr:PH domain-containing protein [Saprospiraceae bacterium]
MKKSDFDFSTPNRQSYVAIILILFKTINVVVRQLLPILFVILVGGSGKKGDYILWLVIIIAILTMLYSIVNFFRTYFMIINDELILHTGIFQRKKTSIPFARIQSINFEQNIIHQLFSVLKLKIDTAGSEKSEFEFHAIEADKAHALRDIILSGKTATFPPLDADIVTPPVPEYTPILCLSEKDLIKAGLTENHIKSGGLIFLFLFWIYQNLQEIGVDVDEYSENIPEWEAGVGKIVSLIFFLVCISVVISLVRSVIKNYDLRFLRSSHGFKVVSGLFTKREVSAFDHKIQHITWSDNLLKRLIGFKDLSLYQATGTGTGAVQNITIPGCNEGHIQGVVTTLFGPTDFDGFAMRGIDKRYFIRFSVILCIIMVLVMAANWYFDQMQNIPLIALVCGYLVLSRYISYRKKAFGHNDHLMYIRGGVYGDKAEVLPMYKIQALQIHQSPYQTKNLLCSLTLFTASGRIKIPYIDVATGNRLADLLIYKVETDKRKWI